MNRTQRKPDAVPARSAANAVRERLQACQKALRRAVRDKTLSPKALHDLRVACRRAETALRLCRDIADSSSWCWLRRKLRGLRRASNFIRDDDVLRSWLKQNAAESSGRLRRALKRHRSKVIPGILKRARRLLEDRRFARQVKNIARRLGTSGRSETWPALFGQRLFDELHRFIASFPKGELDAATLHSLRINGKRVRYASEIISEVWPEADCSRLRTQLQDLQQHAGTVHDLQVGRMRLEALASQSPQRPFRRLLQFMSDRSEAASQSCEMWWKECPLDRSLADCATNALRLIRSGGQHEP